MNNKPRSDKYNRLLFIIFFGIIGITIIQFLLHSTGFMYGRLWWSDISLYMLYASSLICIVAIICMRAISGEVKLLLLTSALCFLLFSSLFEWVEATKKAGTRLASPPPMADSKLESLITKNIEAADWRSVDELRNELKSKGKTPNRGGGLFGVLPFVDTQASAPILPLGYEAHSDTISCNEGGFWPHFLTDRYGFNNKDTVWDSNNKRNVLLVGDSFALDHA